MKVNDIVERYIALRDKKSAIKKEYDDKVANIEKLMEKVEGVLLKHFEETGAESVKTAVGTAYKSKRTSATVADWDSFLAHVQKHEAWELLEHRASKKAVEEYKSAHEEVPPGINWSSEIVVNIRRG
jgi:hypothetical protein